MHLLQKIGGGTVLDELGDGFLEDETDLHASCYVITGNAFTPVLMRDAVDSPRCSHYIKVLGLLFNPQSIIFTLFALPLVI
ncbi:hypothetical protein FOPE_12713 [Fonsecaea pedrosoi]|nr:hypothetical protein FOPE_12713 [Fonsecaea pedrosoi]